MAWRVIVITGRSTSEQERQRDGAQSQQDLLTDGAWHVRKSEAAGMTHGLLK